MRYRERLSEVPGGTSQYPRFAGTPYEYPVVKNQGLYHGGEFMYDETNVGPGLHDHPMSKTSTDMATNKSFSATGFSSCSYWKIGHDYPTFSMTPQDYSYWKTSALSRINPNKPRVDLPLFLFELREIPRALRDLGHFLRGGRVDSKSLADQYLAYKFGWAPLFSDLWKLIHLGEFISNDHERLVKALEKQSYSGTLHSSQAQEGGGIVFTRPQVWDHWLRSEEDFTRTTRLWFTASLEQGFSWSRPPNRFSDIRRVLGLNLSAATIWNMIPWTWLIDYFVNVSDFLDANRGTLPFKIKSLCIMHKETLLQDYVYHSHSGYLTIQYHYNGNVNVGKKRVVYPYPTAQLTFKPDPLVGKLGILGALATSRALKR